MAEKTKKILIVYAVIFMIAVFVWLIKQQMKDVVVNPILGNSISNNNVSSDNGDQAEPSVNLTNQDTLELKDNKAREREQYLVSRVIDGDTIELKNGVRVRYIGINTPEITKGKNECFGNESYEKNRELVEGQYVSLEKDISETDKYGRLLRYVWLGETMINQLLVARGYAQVATYPPDVKYQSIFLEAQSKARAQNLGLWGDVCENNQTTNNQSVPNTKCPIKGNISSASEKIYHVPGCDYYEQTYIDESKGERWFCSEEEAITSGWRKAKNCP